MWNATGYEETFARFDASNGRWIPTWNWAAFLLGAFWYLYKGLWVKAILYIVVGAVLGFITGGFGVLLIWFAGGVLGNYDMYLLYRKHTQLYHGAGVDPQAVPGVTSPSAPVGSAGTSRPVAAAWGEDRKRALDQAHAQGLLTDAEYAVKSSQLAFEQERQAKLAALDNMRRNGLISEVEYETKHREIQMMNPAAGSTPPRQEA